MKAVITGETDRLVGVNLRDNDDVEHVMEMEKDGRITAHQQDGYPDDASKREHWEDENVTQARRYARFHVYRERGYETLPRYENPDRLAAVVLSHGGLNDVGFEHYFGDLYRRVDRDDYADLAPSVAPDDFRMYQLDVYLDEDLDEITEAFAQWARDVDDRIVDDDGESDLPLAEAVSAALGQGPEVVEDARVEEVDYGKIATFEAVSYTYLKYYRDFNQLTTSQDERIRDRDPDAEIQFLPLDFATMDEFWSFLAVHLRAQVRDCYLGMGVEPPEFYRVLGPGMWTFIKKYKHLDVYEDYHDVAADIDGYHYPMAD